jgi:hypothetical protein
MKTNLLILLTFLFLLTGCAGLGGTGDYFAGTSQEVASCFKASGSSTVMGQTSADASGCKCQISPQAGLRVTEAAVSSDGSQCYMKVAPAGTGSLVETGTSE